MNKVKYYSGEDLLYKVTLTDGDGNSINFVDVIDMEIQFINPYQNGITKIKADGGIVQGDVPNEYKVELQDAETVNLKQGTINVRITITTPNASFSDSEATSILEDNFILI